MVVCPSFMMDAYLEDTNLELENGVFINFVIYETLHFGTYYGILKLANTAPMFFEYPFLSGGKLRIELTIDDKVHDFKFVIYKPLIDQECVTILLLPEIYMKLGKDKLSKGYEDTIDNIIKTVASDVGITETDIESTSIEKRKFLQLNQTNFNFIKNNIKYAKNDNSNFVFFIDKMNKLKFYSIKYLKSLDTLLMIDDFIQGLTVEDKAVQYQLTSGFGSTGYYFDWDNNKMEEIEFDMDGVDDNNRLSKLGIRKDLQSKKNSIMMLEPIGEDIYYNKNYNYSVLENSVLTKNYFDYYVNFITEGCLDYTPIIPLELNFRSMINDENKAYNGQWIIYEAIHFFALEGYTTTLKLANSFLHGMDKNKKYS